MGMTEKRFNSRMRPAKIGTVSMNVVFDGRCNLLYVGSYVRWKEIYNGKWNTGIIRNTWPLQIDRM